jgi:hypothetical protein
VVTGRWSGLTSAFGQFTCAQKQSTRPVRLVLHGTGASGQASRGAESAGVMIEREARPVMYDRTRLDVEGAYWTLTGRWHCRVRSLRGARPVMSLRAWCCAIGASGRFLERVRSVTTGVSSHLEFCPVKGL